MRKKISFLILTILTVGSLYFLAFPKGDEVFAGAGALGTVKITKATVNGPVTLEEGALLGSHYGFSTAGIGDLNDDGVEDVAVGALRHDNAANYPGAVFIHFMNTDGSIDSTVLLEHDTVNGATLTPGEFNDYAAAVEGLGDLNGDGVEDIAVGAPIKSLGGADFGSVFIHFMNTDGSIDSTVEINNSTLNGPTYTGNLRYGDSIANIGDLNDDGVTDIAVGMENFDSSQGKVFIHFMNTDGTIDSTVQMDESNVPGLTLANGDNYGAGISGIGDMNGDGVEDIAISAPGDGPGSVFIHFMNTDGSVDSIAEINGSTPNGPKLSGNFYGQNVTTLGDLDLDGVTDLAVSAHNDSSAGSGFGAFHVHFMNSDGSIKRTSKISSLRNNVPDTSGLYTFGLDNVGDINDDGVDDILAGAYFDDDEGNRTGAAYLHFMELTPDITVTQSGGNTAVSEDGLTDTVQITLESLQPTSNVTITLTPNSQLTLDKATLVFTPLDWDTPQSFTVSAVDDILVEGDHIGLITYSISSLDSKYNDYELLPTTVASIDDNDPGLDVSFQNGGSVQELLVTDIMYVSLLTPPTDDVIINISPDSQLFVSSTSLTFTTANWDTPQEVVVYGIDDYVLEGAHSGFIDLVTSSTDVNYISVENEQEVSITDGPGDSILFTPYYTETDVLNEGDVETLGELMVFYDPAAIDPINTPVLVITADPNDDVDLGNGPGVPFDYEFDPFGLWFDPQYLEGTIVNDIDVEGEHEAIITFDVSLVYFGVVQPDPYTFLIQDNDPGVVVSQSGGSTSVTEGGSGDSVSVVMATQPTDDVTVSVSFGEQILVSPEFLTFTSVNWDTPQIFTISAIDDSVIEGSHSDNLSFTVLSLDGDYDEFSVNDISVTVLDNDSPAPVDNPSSRSSSGSIMPHIRFKNNIKETESRFVDLEAWVPGTISYYEISNTPDFSKKQTFLREYLKKDLYWDLCGGESVCSYGNKKIYARFYSDYLVPRDYVIEIDYNGSCPYFKDYIRIGKKNDSTEVLKVQEFLNRELGLNMVVDGILGKETDKAIRLFQEKYSAQILRPWRNLNSSTGWWYITTKGFANVLMGC